MIEDKSIGSELAMNTLLYFAFSVNFVYHIGTKCETLTNFPFL